MHVENVIGADRRAALQAVGLGRAGVVGDEAQGGAATGRAIDLEEDEVVAPGQEADAIGGDALLADGAPDTVEKRAKVILRTHPRGV